MLSEPADPRQETTAPAGARDKPGHVTERPAVCLGKVLSELHKDTVTSEQRSSHAAEVRQENAPATKIQGLHSVHMVTLKLHVNTTSDRPFTPVEKVPLFCYKKTVQSPKAYCHWKDL